MAVTTPAVTLLLLGGAKAIMEPQNSQRGGSAAQDQGLEETMLDGSSRDSGGDYVVPAAGDGQGQDGA